MAGIGKIALSRKSAYDNISKGQDRSGQIAYDMGNQKRQEDSASRMAILSSLGTLADGFKQNTESWSKVEQGAKAAGVEMEKASFGDKLLRGFGIQNVDLDKKHKAGDGMWEYSGSELMNIGEKSQAGTLESFLGDKKIGDLYGGATKEFQAYQYKGEGGQGLSAMDKGEDFKSFSKKLRGEIDLTEPPEDGKKPYNEETYKQMKTAEATSPLSKEEYGSLIKDTYEGPVTEVSQDEWEQKANEKIYGGYNESLEQEMQRTAQYGPGPKDPLRDQRLKIAQGIEEGVFDEGFSLEDWHEEEDRQVPFRRPDTPIQMESPDDLAQDIPLEETTIHQDMMGAPEDPLQNQRLKISQGIEEGVFDEGFTLEDWHKEEDRQVPFQRPDTPIQMDSNEEPGSLNDIPLGQTTIQQDMMGAPEDKLASQRQNLMKNQLGTGNNMSLEDVFSEQDRLNKLLEPLEYDHAPGGLAVSVTGRRR